MDIKDLNRSQFLLLILLIMMVTSITTATVTVTLMDQSPQAGVINTINRVIERVVPGATTTVIQIVKEPVSVDQGEQIVRAAELMAPFMVRLTQATPTGSVPLGSGFIVRNGWAVTALSNLPTGQAGIPAEIKTVTLSRTGVSVLAEVAMLDEKNSLAFLKFVPLEGFATTSPTFAEITAKSGQTSIVLSLSENHNIEIMTGLVMGVISAGNAVSSSSPITAEVIRTGSVLNDNLGGPMINLKGEVVGLGVSRGYALAAQALKLMVDQLPQS
ncbi:MAG: hypothetical protein COV08_03390 [Candidatus Vogelbacteria bacterium CG10_big_fil_rev_8_21_14_0_10_49_38]|uniref:Serine protease n=1 Tax=Candidatus Vogelbacteria bacterium CG10_big_fil_rev_8_21_14_0_10_49_38 TaxID=1975043 RepID=A0A2H0RJ26_9BACT|nr:MAG: hypothetical protein BK006_03385 [bacterium CG10_49_38]PIR45785.1 MAG: hypothetical protein COV08_03390 [Candidatus Vogelbacteria bacterium CG10_big_fil_rev_8_21_14_0_10_49_38]